MIRGGMVGPGMLQGDLPGLPGNIIQTRELLYRLMISQLFYDGYQQVRWSETEIGLATTVPDWTNLQMGSNRI